MEHLISEESDFAKRIAYLPFSVRRLLLLNDAMAWKKNPHKIITMSHHHIAKGNRIYKMNKADLSNDPTDKVQFLGCSLLVCCTDSPL